MNNEFKEIIETIEGKLEEMEVKASDLRHSALFLQQCLSDLVRCKKDGGGNVKDC